MDVGVVIPVGAFAPWLPEAVEAVLAERPAAVVVVDDAADVPVPPQPDGVLLVRRARRGGPAAARAIGVDHLHTEAVALCDADDAWEPGSLAPRVAALEHGAAWCFGRALVVGPDGRPTGERWAEPPAGPLPAAALFAANPIPTSSVVLRRDALLAAGGPATDLPVAEDWDLWLRLVARGDLPHAVPEARVRYRRHPGGLTSDIARLARAQRTLHERHAALVAPAAVRAALRGDDTALAGALPRPQALLPWLRARRPSPRPLLVRRRGADQGVP